MPANALDTLIFDVDGTLADTESTHRAAFNHAFATLGLGWEWDEALYTKLLDVPGDKERILHYWETTQPDLTALGAMTRQDAAISLQQRKTIAYARAVNSGAVGLRPGVLRLMDEALSQGMQLAIATTTSPVNIAALLRNAVGSDWRRRFTAIGDASTAPLKKPHPQVYLQVLAELSVTPAQCLTFENCSNGLRAATAAGLSSVITPTRYTAQQDFSGALRLLPDLSHVTLAQLRRWHGQSQRPACMA